MSKRQLAMVMYLNKCIGCQTCTVACKTQWTNRNGREYMYWNNVETYPGTGYPKNWMELGGGFDAAGDLQPGGQPVELLWCGQHVPHHADQPLARGPKHFADLPVAVHHGAVA